MSGDVCQPPPSGKRQTLQQISPQSKIPISSPLSLRKCGSINFRVEGENLPYNRVTRISPEVNHKGVYFPRVVQRGHSYMENVEKKRGAYGTRPSVVASRPQITITEPRNTGAQNRAFGAAHQTPTRNRSLSLSVSNTFASSKSPTATVAGVPKTPPSSPDTRHQLYRDWDLDSITSTASGLSVASCDHASVARNGTTFSGRSKKYVVHCSEHSGATGEDYLTPTQRAHKQVKRLKQLLHQTQQELNLKDTDILRLTKEVVELRLYKAALNSPDDKSNSSSDAVTVREVTDEDVVDTGGENHIGVEQNSCTDSGNYDDLTNSSVHSKDSTNLGEDTSLSPYKVKTPVQTADKAITVDLGPRDSHSEHQRLVFEYERRLQELVRSHEEECHQMKQKHNDKVDELLQRLSEVNARYWELVPDLDSARERIKELEQQLEEACKNLEEQEKQQKESNLQMCSKDQETAKPEQDKQIVESTHGCSSGTSRVSVPELLHQLEVTQNELENVKDLEYASSSNSMQPLLSAKEAVSLWVLGARKAMYRQLIEARNKTKIDPEITLQFLKSAIYYFLTDKENNQGHLRAIQSILGFTPSEISNIDKARMT